MRKILAGVFRNSGLRPLFELAKAVDLSVKLAGFSIGAAAILATWGMPRLPIRPETLPYAMGGVSIFLCGCAYYFAKFLFSTSTWTLGYRVVHDSSSLKEVGGGTYAYSVRTTVKAVRSGVALAQSTLLFTGGGKTQLTHASARHAFTVPQGNRTRVIWVFDQALHVGDVGTIEYSIQADEGAVPMDRRLSKTIRIVTDFLSLRVSLTNAAKWEKYFRMEFDADDEIVSKCEARLDTDTPVAVWEVKNPAIGHRYEIRW